jgi:hypothetical protein
MKFRTVTVILLILCISPVFSLDWRTVTLSGTWPPLPKEDNFYSLAGDLTGFSFGTEKAVQSNGDLWLEIKKTNAAIYFRLGGYWYMQLPGKSEPTSLDNIPKEFGSQSWKDFEPTYMKVGSYYLICSSDEYSIIQILDFKSNTNHSSWDGSIKSYNITLSFKYLKPHSINLLALRKVLNPNESVPTTAIPVVTTTLQPKPPVTISTSTSTITTSVTQGDSLSNFIKDYDLFQKNVSNFLQQPLNKDSLSTCDKLLVENKSLKTRATSQINDLEIQFVENSGRISSLSDLIKNTSDPQVKDRATTKLNALNVETDTLSQSIKDLKSRAISLDGTEKILQEYRIIIIL